MSKPTVEEGQTWKSKRPHSDEFGYSTIEIVEIMTQENAVVLLKYEKLTWDTGALKTLRIETIQKEYHKL
jgi:hypothetical protein